MENGNLSWRPKIGVLVDDLSASHLSWAIINSVNSLVSKGSVDVSIFYDNLVRPCSNVEAALLPSVHIIGFDGILVATSLNTASKLIRLPSNGRKFFYCWDLEWQRMSQQDKNYGSLINIYRNSSYGLIARTVEHARILSQTWNRPVNNVVEEADIEAILRIGLENESS